MMTGKAQGSVQPYAYGSLLQASTYGATIPRIYGCTVSPLLATWVANLREGGSSKKFKQLKKGGPPTYCENITMMVGYAPILGVLQTWNNGGKQALEFTYQTFTGSGPWTVTDPHFYAVTGVTATGAVVNLTDNTSGLSPVPMWNAAMSGPNPTRSSYYRHYPYVYRWLPSYGNVVYTDAFDEFVNDPEIKVYYARLVSATNYQTPLAMNRLHFEKVLGDGDEYIGNFSGTSTPLSTQQIFYPNYSGVGSQTIDLGTSGTIPKLQAEVMGSFGVHPRGDADFVDMIEDIIKSGQAQTAIDTPGYAGHSRLGHGAGAFDYPGCIQFKCVYTSIGNGSYPLVYDVNVTADNFLVVMAGSTDGTGSAVDISDTLLNTWTPVFPGTPNYQVWWCKNATSDADTVTITGLGTNWTVTMLEVAGVDTFDSAAIGTNGAANITTTNQNGFPAYMLSIGFYPGAQLLSQRAMQQWNLLTDQNEFGNYPANSLSIQQRRTKFPVTAYTSIDTTGLNAQCVLAFKCVQPPQYVQPTEDFLDRVSLSNVRMQARANGLIGSLSMASQQKAADYLNKLYAAANAVPIYVGDKLFSMPLSEISVSDNGASYITPYTADTLINLSTEKGDFLDKSGPPITLKTISHANEDNVLQMQCLNRDSDYNPSTVMQPEQGSLALFGLRKAAATQNNAIQDVAVARKVLDVQVKRAQYGAGDTFTFTLPAKWCLLAPMGAGGSGNFVPPSQAPPLPRMPASDETVISYSATVADGITHLGPFNFPIWTGGKTLVGYLYKNSFVMTTGGVLVPNQMNLNFAKFEPNGGWKLPKGAVITAAYPVGLQFSDLPFAAVGVVGPSGAAFNSDMLPYGPPESLSTTWQVQNSLPGSNSGISTLIYMGVYAYVKTGFSNGLGYIASDMSPTVVDGVLTITDPLADFNKIPVRITSIKENEDLTLTCEAEPFVYGMSAPGSISTDIPTPYTPSTAQSPGSVNPPVFIEATTRLAGAQPTGQLPFWIAVSAPGINYGGCVVMVSTDGGASYPTALGTIVGSAITGHNTADWPASADPDTTNDLLLDLTESRGTLQSYPTAARDNYQYPCYIAGGGAFNIPYELFSYNAATMTGTNLYTVDATGAGNEIRRGILAAPSPAVGVDHPISSRFAFLDPSGNGILKTSLDPTWIGKTLYFKFLAFNTFGTAQQSLSDATAYPYTPTGVPGTTGPAGGFLVNGI